MTFDYLQAIFWSLTYIALISYAIRYKTHGIPLLAICLNFAWEAIALIESILMAQFSGALLIHISWFTLDLVMVLLYLFYETKISENRREKLCFLGGFVFSAAVLAVLFRYGYMLQTCFLIDWIMAVSFVLFVAYDRCPRNKHLYFIGILKLLGDLFAWLCYGQRMLMIQIIGICVLVCNIGYMIILLKKGNQKTSNA